MTATGRLLDTWADGLAARLHHAGLLPGTGPDVLREVRSAVHDRAAALRPSVVYLATPLGVHALPWRIEPDHAGIARRVWDSQDRCIGDLIDPATAELVVATVNTFLPDARTRETA